ncbi:MAG: alanine racemase, partial [Acidobacteria bacterium]|nr:alanine racemase [Acidobacteriota bacterium]
QWIHAIDSVDLLTRIDQAAEAMGRRVRVLVQVDLAGEATKFGAGMDEVPAILAAAAGMRGAALVGLMLLPPQVDDAEDARPWFRQLREQRDRWLDAGTPPALLQELSMGMSHDFTVAIEEGATIVRVGSAIFGQRDYASTGA